MEIEFLPKQVLLPGKPCFLLCGLNGRSEWAKTMIKEKAHSKYNVVEQEQFTPTIKSKQIGAPATVKQFNVPIEWIVGFQSKFVVVVELFLMEDEAVDIAQIVEDIMFASKYVHENHFEHIAVVLSKHSLSAEAAMSIRKGTRRTVFLDQQKLDTTLLFEQLAQLSSQHYAGVLVEKYKKRQSTLASRFLNPWSCQSFYCFKSGMAFEAAGKVGNALREFHASYSAIIEEGNGLAAKGMSRRSFCEFTRPAVDIIFLRMVQCMVRMGSVKEGEAFLRGHLTWFSEAFSDKVYLTSWKVSMLSQYGRIMDSLQNTLAAMYYSLATDQAILLLAVCQIGPATTKALSQQSLTAIDYFCLNTRYKRHMIVEQVKLTKMLSLSHASSHPSKAHIDRLLLENGFRGWPGLLSQVLQIAVKHYPDDIAYVWQYSSITKDWETLRSRVKSLPISTSAILEFPRFINNVIELSVNFTQMVCFSKSPSQIVTNISNHSGVVMTLSKLLIELSNGHLLEHNNHHELCNQTTIYTTFTPATPSELSIAKVTLFLDSICIRQLVFDQESFSTDHSCQIILPPAHLAIELEAVTGIVNTDTFALLKIKSEADAPVQGVLKIIKAPSDLDIAPAFPFGIGENGVNVLKIPIRAAMTCTGSIHFDVDFSCDGHKCDPMIDLSLPVEIVEPLKVDISCFKRVANPTTSCISELFTCETKISFTKNTALINGNVVVRVDGDSIGDVDVDGQRVVDFMSKESPSEVVIEYTFENANKKGKVRVRPPAIPLQQIMAFYQKASNELVLVNQSGEATVVLDIEKKGPVMTQGPKRHTLTLAASSITRLPFTVVPVKADGQYEIVLFVDGIRATPDWLIA